MNQPYVLYGLLVANRYAKVISIASARTYRVLSVLGGLYFSMKVEDMQ